MTRRAGDRVRLIAERDWLLVSVAVAGILEQVDAALREHYGQAPVRASVSFVGVEPIEVLRFEPIPGERAYVSLGMSRHPMTAASAELAAADGPRAELMLHVRDGADRFVDVWRRLALLAAAPAVEGVVYAPGLTVDTGEPLVPGCGCTGVAVTTSPLAGVATPAGDVAVFQVLPATPSELAWARVHGSAALHERWLGAAVDMLDLERPAVALQ